MEPQHSKGAGIKFTVKLVEENADTVMGRDIGKPVGSWVILEHKGVVK